MHHVYITHGYDAAIEKHWFPWLERELTALGIGCTRLPMPNSATPTPEEWVGYLAENAPINDQAIFVGHSLGCITTLSYLASQQKQPLGCVLVSGFFEPLHTIPELEPFAKFYQKQPACLPLKAYCVSAVDDTVVPHYYTAKLAEHLNADYFRLKQGGHFLDREGCRELPIVLSLIKQLCNIGDFQV